jgi:hypothetical protein
MRVQLDTSLLSAKRTPCPSVVTWTQELQALITLMTIAVRNKRIITYSNKGLGELSKKLLKNLQQYSKSVYQFFSSASRQHRGYGTIPSLLDLASDRKIQVILKLGSG